VAYHHLHILLLRYLQILDDVDHIKLFVVNSDGQHSAEMTKALNI